MLYRSITILLFFSTILSSTAQVDSKDSLRRLLAQTQDNRKRVDILNDLAYEYYDFQDTTAFGFAREAQALAIKINYPLGLKYAYTLVAIGHTTQGDFKKATYFHRLSDLVKIPNEKDRTSYNLSAWGVIYRDQAKYDSALALFNLARALILKENTLQLAFNFKNKASVYLRKFSLREALVNCDSAMFYYTKSTVKNSILEMDVYGFLGEIYRNLADFEKSKMYYDKMCELASKLQDYYHQITCDINESKLAFDIGDIGQALRTSFSALEKTKDYNYPTQYVALLIQLGEIYESLAEFDVASEYFFKALKISDAIGLDYERGIILSELAWLNKEQGDFKYAMEYIGKAQEIRERIGDQKGIANCHTIRWLIHLQLGEYQQSIDEQTKGLLIREKIDYKEGIAASQFNLALVYEQQGKLDKALALLLMSTSLEESINNKSGLAISYNTLAEMYIKTSQFSKALTYLRKANDLGKRTGSKLLLRNNAANYVSYFERTGDFRKALAYQKLYQLYDDSVYSSQSATKLIEVQALYNVEKKEKDLEILRQKQKTNETQIKLQSAELSQKNLIILFASLLFIFVILAGIYGAYLYRQKQKTNMELKEQKEEIQAQSEELTEANHTLLNLNNSLIEKQEEIQAQTEELTEAYELISRNNRGLEEKVNARTEELREAFKELDTFFYRSSHDFRRPLTTFMGLAEVAKITVKDSNALELFDKVNETAHTLDKMLIKLQSISDLGAQHLVYKEVLLKELISEVLDQFQEAIAKNHVQIMVEIDAFYDFFSYPVMIKIIIENLLENAIHFCNGVDPYVKISCQKKENQVILSIQDNGQGIDPIYHSKIFEMYFRANQNSKGNGLGLYIVKKAVSKLNGRIDFTSTLHQGTAFNITLPLSQ